MDFFGEQERSRRNTTILVGLFILAVIGIILLTYFGLAAACRYMPMYDFIQVNPYSWWQPKLFLYVTLFTTVIVTGSSLLKMNELRTGGSSVASMLRGTPVLTQTSEFKERQLRNIVEEMAIASGITVPNVYVLRQEMGINAFAAGFSLDDATIAVTNGALQMLTREELQGVVAHEFGHVLNGDMRMNMRLISFLFGILSISVTGQILMRSGGRNRKGGPFILGGLVLYLIGSIGLFFARLIQCAVSRQRESLADASSVQFTRNPSGLAKALKKIGGYSLGSEIQAQHRQEVSHMMFSDAFEDSWARLFSTHPPIVDRIRALDPSFKGEFEFIDAAVPLVPEGLSPQALVAGRKAKEPIQVRPLMLKLGKISNEDISTAQTFLRTLPAEVVTAAQDATTSQAVVFALLLSEEERVRAQQLDRLKTGVSAFVMNEVGRLSPTITKLGRRAQLPLMDLAIPSLRQLSKPQFLEFKKCVVDLIEADQKVCPHEFVLLRVLSKGLEPQQRKVYRGRTKYWSFASVRSEIQLLLSVLAGVGGKDGSASSAAFQEGIRKLTRESMVIAAEKERNVANLHRALVNLRKTTPSLKREIMDACASVVHQDGAVTLEEAELLRAVGATLDCPIPMMG